MQSSLGKFSQLQSKRNKQMGDLQHRVKGVKKIFALFWLIDGIEFDSKCGHSQGVKRTASCPIKHVDFGWCARAIEADLSQGITGL